MSMLGKFREKLDARGAYTRLFVSCVSLTLFGTGGVHPAYSDTQAPPLILDSNGGGPVQPYDPEYAAILEMLKESESHSGTPGVLGEESPLSPADESEKDSSDDAAEEKEESLSDAPNGDRADDFEGSQEAQGLSLRGVTPMTLRNEMDPSDERSLDSTDSRSAFLSIPERILSNAGMEKNAREENRETERRIEGEKKREKEKQKDIEEKVERAIERTARDAKDIDRKTDIREKFERALPIAVLPVLVGRALKDMVDDISAYRHTPGSLSPNISMPEEFLTPRLLLPDTSKPIFPTTVSSIPRPVTMSEAMPLSMDPEALSPLSEITVKKMAYATMLAMATTMVAVDPDLMPSETDAAMIQVAAGAIAAAVLRDLQSSAQGEMRSDLAKMLRIEGEKKLAELVKATGSTYKPYLTFIVKSLTEDFSPLERYLNWLRSEGSRSWLEQGRVKPMEDRGRYLDPNERVRSLEYRNLLDIVRTAEVNGMAVELDYLAAVLSGKETIEALTTQMVDGRKSLARTVEKLAEIKESGLTDDSPAVNRNRSVSIARAHAEIAIENMKIIREQSEAVAKEIIRMKTEAESKMTVIQKFARDAEAFESLLPEEGYTAMKHLIGQMKALAAQSSDIQAVSSADLTEIDAVQKKLTVLELEIAASVQSSLHQRYELDRSISRVQELARAVLTESEKLEYKALNTVGILNSAKQSLKVFGHLYTDLTDHLLALNQKIS